MQDPSNYATASSQATHPFQDSQKEDFISSCNDTLDCLQQVIRRFSDHPEGISSSDAESFWQQKSNDTTQRRTLKDIVHLYAPVNLEAQFEQLYCLLHPCLVDREQETNAAAFCLGHRGMGKGILLERCLQAFRDELIYYYSSSAANNKRRPMFRVVQVHGVMIPGHNVSLVVKEMLQQLSRAAFDESAEFDAAEKTPPRSAISLTQLEEEEEEQRPVTKRQKTQVERGLRLRNSTFESNLQLLSETLKLARVDQIPILIVLDEVEAFLGGASNSTGGDTSNNSGNNNSNNQNHLEKSAGGRDRQLLLYHLLDRVATQGSNVCLVGLTQHLTMRGMLEKRIKSRMEGTSKEIFVGPCSSVNALTNLLLAHVLPPNHQTQNQKQNQHNTTQEPTTKYDPLKVLHHQMTQLLTLSSQEDHPEGQKNSAASSTTDLVVQQRVWETLEREYRLGRNVRWFSRIFAFALSLYRGDWMRYRYEGKPGSPSPTFQARYIMEALVAQGASISMEPPGSNNNNNNNNNQRQPNNGNKRSSNLLVMSANSSQASTTAVDPRIQALIDLSGPQVALLLAARRILSRDAQWNGETTTPPPLTLARMLQELNGFKANQQRHSRHLLWVAFTELLEINLLRPAADHCGTGPFQFDHQVPFFGSISEAEDIPLHLLVDINRELMPALQSNLMECSTALREWGRKTNN